MLLVFYSFVFFFRFVFQIISKTTSISVSFFLCDPLSFSPLVSLFLHNELPMSTIFKNVEMYASNFKQETTLLSTLIARQHPFGHPPRAFRISTDRLIWRGWIIFINKFFFRQKILLMSDCGFIMLK